MALGKGLLLSQLGPSLSVWYTTKSNQTEPNYVGNKNLKKIMKNNCQAEFQEKS